VSFKNLGLLVILSICLELLAIWKWSQTPFFTTPIPDSDVTLYWFLAKLIKDYGITIQEYPVFFSLYYAYFYYFLSLLGNPVTLAILSNLIFYIISLILIILISKELFNNKIALLTGIIFLLTKVFLFYSILPIKTMAFIAIFLGFLLAFIREKYLYAGFLGGLAGNIEGIFIPLFGMYLLYSGVKSGIKKAVLLLLSFLLASLPSLAVNYTKNRLSLSAPTSGIHFYIGNHERANGVYRKVKGIRPNAFGHYFDAKRVAERTTGRKLTPDEVNKFWFKKGLSFIVGHPVEAIKLYIRKILLFFNNYEIPNNFNLYFVSQKVPVINLLPVDFSTAVFWGFMGFLLSTALRENKRELDIILLLYPFLLSMFFITSRYRLIYYVPLIIYASYALHKLWGMWNITNKIQINKKKIPILIIFIFSTIMLGISKFSLIEGDRAGFYRVFKSKYHLTLKLKKILSKTSTSSQLEKEAKIFSKAKMYEIAEYVQSRSITAHSQ